MEIITERLKIIPVDLEFIEAAIRNDSGKIRSLGYKATDEWPEPDLMEALPEFRNLIINNGVNGFGLWVILEKITHEIVGSIGFLGMPDGNGNVEIGFGIIPSKRKLGYCLESCAEMVKWAFKQKNINCIKSQCQESNSASRSILAKTGFIIKGHNEGMINWERFLL